MGTTVLQVGVPPPLAEALTAKYDAPMLPITAGREDFLAEHGASVKAIVDAGQAHAAKTALTLRNLNQYLTDGTLATPVVAPTR
jgi:hypothetical protein